MKRETTVIYNHNPGLLASVLAKSKVQERPRREGLGEGLGEKA
jgi:hypothetical protein